MVKCNYQNKTKKIKEINQNIEKRSFSHVKTRKQNYPVYNPEKWNENKYIKQTHNCYAYALNLIDIKRANLCKKLNECSRPQLGEYSGYEEEFNATKVTCKKMEERMMADNPNIKKLKKNQDCPVGFYKIMLYCSTDDYHFFRQDNTGLWSHKHGWRLATNKDLKGRLIRDPELADKGPYTMYCGTYAVPNLAKYKYI